MSRVIIFFLLGVVFVHWHPDSFSIYVKFLKGGGRRNVREFFNRNNMKTGPMLITLKGVNRGQQWA